MAGRARPDPIRIVEAAYAWEPDEARWLDEIVRLTSPFDVGGGVIAYTVDIAEQVRVGTVCRSARANEHDARALARLTESFPSAVARQVLAPTEFVGNATFRLSRLARQVGDAAPPPALDAGLLPEMWAIVSGDPRSRAMLVCFPRRATQTFSPDKPFPHRDRRALGLAGAHLGAALRLRSLVRPTSHDAETEAVFTPRGKLLHAAGPAVPQRATLATAVAAVQRARGRLRHTSPDEALRAWSALVQGRWTILDTVESDGKRLVLARRNPLRKRDLLDLTEDERDVTWLAAHGHSYKYIAYELGHPLSTVASRLRRAMAKLRVGSRIELLNKLGVARSQK